MTAAPFDPRRVRLHRARARARAADGDFLRQRVADDLAERLEAVNRRFERVLVIGGAAAFAEAVAARPELAARVGRVLGADWDPGPGDIALNPEHLPFAEDSFDLVISILALHWVNDLPGALIQIRRALAPDGLFLGAMFGGGTLNELREALLVADSDTRAGAALRVAPFADAQDLGGLLQRAGLALPVADHDPLVVRYADLFGLLRDLRAMGETSALAARAPPLTRAGLVRAAEVYAARFADPDGRVRATFDIVAATGWRPHASQQQPLKPGSAGARLADALGVREHSAGEKAGE